MVPQIGNVFPAKHNHDHLLAVYMHARRLVLCQERARAMQARLEDIPGSLAEAIERDFVAFELEDAERALCRAIRAAEAPPGGGVACPVEEP